MDDIYQQFPRIGPGMTVRCFGKFKSDCFILLVLSLYKHCFRSSNVYMCLGQLSILTNLTSGLFVMWLRSNGGKLAVFNTRWQANVKLTKDGSKTAVLH